MVCSSNKDLIENLGGEGTMLWSPLTGQLSDISQVIENKIVLLYFSAHWCGPCKKFTPVLEQFYKAFKRSRVLSNAKNRREEIEEFERNNFEVLFLSMDYFMHEYQSYASGMPWWCVPYNKQIVLKLANQYGRALSVGIPHLVVIDKNGSVILDDGVEGVTASMRDIESTCLANSSSNQITLTSNSEQHAMSPLQRLSSVSTSHLEQRVDSPTRLSPSTIEAMTTMKTTKQERSPSNNNNSNSSSKRYDLSSSSFYFWQSRQRNDIQTLVELLPETYLQNDGTICSMRELDYKYIMLYFCARWCPPCRTFTPLLNEFYLTLKKSRSDFEILFVSYDNDKQDFSDFFDEMTFCALPYNKPGSEMTSKIANKLGVDNIPTLVMLGPRSSSSCSPSLDGDYGATSGEGYYCSRRPSGGWDCYSEKHGKANVKNNMSGIIDRPLINIHVRNIIEQMQSDCISDFPYYPKNYGNLNCTTSGNVNIEDQKCIIVFHETADRDEGDNIRRCLKMAAKHYKGKESMKFYWVLSDDVANLENGFLSSDSDPENENTFSQIVRETLGLGKAKKETDEIAGGQRENPVMVLLDIPNGGVFYLCTATEINVNNIYDFIKYPGKKRQI